MTISPSTKLSKYYTVADLTQTSTGISNLPTQNELPSLQKLASVLDILRDNIGNFTIASAYRSPLVNAAVGGSSTSRHLFGDAADIIPHTMTAEKYWATILANQRFSNMLGEISYKIPQGSIHVSLPFTNSYGSRVIASARVADREGGSLVYRSISPESVSSYLAKYGLVFTPDTLRTVGIGVGVLALGVGSIMLARAMQRK